MTRDFTRGVLRENPIFVSLLGLCPSLAITTHLVNAIGLGLAVIFVLVASGLTVSIARTLVPRRGRIPAFIAVIAVYVTVVELLMGHYAPWLSDRLGIFVPLIVVNCLIMGRVDAWASRTTPGRAVLDALGAGIGFLLSLSLIAAIRELLGAGTLTLVPVGGFGGVIRVPGLADQPVSVVGTATGALLVAGYLLALFTWPARRQEGRSIGGGGRES